MRCFSLLLAHFTSSRTRSKHVLTLTILKSILQRLQVKLPPNQTHFPDYQTLLFQGSIKSKVSDTTLFPQNSIFQSFKN